MRRARQEPVKRARLAMDDRRTIIIICPECAWSGSAIRVDGDAGAARDLEDLSAGFLSIDAGSKDGPRIVCQNCRITADEHSTP